MDEPEKWMKADKVMELLDCSRSLLCTPEMRQALGEKRIGKRGVRFKKSCVMEYMERENQIEMSSHPKIKINKLSKKIESRLGLW